MRLLALLALLALPLAGCVEEPAAPPPADPCQGPSPPASCAPPPRPEPVDLKETVLMLESGSKDYAWKVERGVKSLVVTVALDGPEGVPHFLAVDYGYTLTGGPDRTVHADGSHGVYGGSPVCLPCFDGEGADVGSLDELAGEWTLHLEWGPSKAQYELQVSVAY